MSKRNPASIPSPAKKRSKLQHNQFQLDHFFSSPKSAGALPSRADTTPQFIQGSSTHSVNPRHAELANPVIIDVDAFDLETTIQPQISKPPPPTKSNDLLKKELPTPLTSGNDGADALQHIAPSNTTPNGRLKKETSTCLAGPGALHHMDPDEFSSVNVDPIDYDAEQQPSRSSKAPYTLLVHALIALSQTRSRIAIINILTNVLRTIIVKHPASLLPAVYLLSNSLGPSFVAIELGLGSSIISRSLQQISGLSGAALRKLYNTSGDPGDVAFAAKSNIRTLIPHPPLSVPYVYESMLKIAACRGQGAAKEKQKIVEKLLLAAIGEEVRYLTRTLCQNLRVGAVRTSILTALARAFSLTPPASIKDRVVETNAVGSLHVPPTLLSELKSLKPQVIPSKGKTRDPARESLSTTFKHAENLIKQVYVKHPSYDQIIPALLENGLDSLAERVPMTVGIPLHPMLGSPTRSLDEIYHRLGDLPFSAEFKYDGQRAQIHASKITEKDYQIKIFSRHLEDMTSKYPDIINLVQATFEERVGMSSFIMDAEVVAIDPISGELKSFQELSGRARKDVNQKDVQIAVCVFAFDLMYLNGKSLLDQSFRERRNALRGNFSARRSNESSTLMAQFDFVKSCKSEEGRTSIEDFMSSAIENRCEGLMIKILDSPDSNETTTKEKQSRQKSLPSTYEPDVRASGWLKLKKDYIEGMGDSLDLIPVGAWHGNGRKSQWWSPVLLALWNPETGRPVAMCKCMSGFTDTFYMSMREQYSLDSELCSKQPKWECDFGGFKPDVFFKPREVWEIRGADITESPVSVAAHGIVSSSCGLSLRFPRFIRTRDDKHIEMASTPSFLAEIWRGQQGKNDAGNDEGDLIDVHEDSSEVEDDSEEEDDSI